jgi:pimeloyl-ACP methyl ester carboxylesterase
MTEVRTIAGAAVEYVLQSRGPTLAVIFHGGHMRADVEIGQRAFVDSGLSTLHPSRPGYGRTPLAAGPGQAQFADRIAQLAVELGYTDVIAVGVSAGGRTAVSFAARHPDLVRALVLESAVSFESWPAKPTKLAASVLFRPGIERATWALTRGIFRLSPSLALRGMFASLSTRRPAEVVSRLTSAERATLVDVFARMRSGSGFLNDLQAAGAMPGNVTQPTLIVASRHDATVDPHHARILAAHIPASRIVMTDALSHFVWVGPGAADEYDAVTDFISQNVGPSASD